ncbi:hypothetical protein [Actinomyces sp. MRS3W]|uniref:hypothetical protein n=1 Tax=Actinomyces sp. MRS3W TaxID=2800796 RepID=UPI0028FD988F|nr:hypothetical protein [Actinomyces sp. MRS3W]MDU0349169.1 hypothetical protein [Actinomyces sp. MRS3W]
MDATRSSLETPPPAWGRYDDPSGRRAGHPGRDGFLAAWALLTCILVGLLLMVAITPSLYNVSGLGLVLPASTGWAVLTRRVLHDLR